MEPGGQLERNSRQASSMKVDCGIEIASRPGRAFRARELEVERACRVTRAVPGQREPRTLHLGRLTAEHVLDGVRLRSAGEALSELLAQVEEQAEGGRHVADAFRARLGQQALAQR